MPPTDEPAPSQTTKIAYWRKVRGFSQRGLAARTGISEKTIERLDQGRAANPNVRHLLAIADVLQVPVMDLVEDDWRSYTVAGKPFTASPPAD